MPYLAGDYGKNKMRMLNATCPFIFFLGASLPAETTSTRPLPSEPPAVTERGGEGRRGPCSDYFGFTAHQVNSKRKAFDRTFDFAHRLCGSGIQVGTQQKRPVSAP